MTSLSSESSGVGCCTIKSAAELPVVNVVLPIERRLKKGAAWVLLARTSGIGVTMLCNIALARWLAPDAFGSFLLLSSLLALGSMLAMLGLNAAVIRFVSHSLGEGDFDARCTVAAIDHYRGHC